MCHNLIITGTVSVCCKESIGRVCPTDVFLQLRIIRVSVDRVNLIVRDENTSIFVEGNTFRLRICNWRRLHIGLGLKKISLRLLISTIGDKCIDAASITVNEMDLLVKVKGIETS